MDGDICFIEQVGDSYIVTLTRRKDRSQGKSEKAVAINHQHLVNVIDKILTHHPAPRLKDL